MARTRNIEIYKNTDLAEPFRRIVFYNYSNGLVGINGHEIPSRYPMGAVTLPFKLEIPDVGEVNETTFDIVFSADTTTKKLVVEITV